MRPALVILAAGMGSRYGGLKQIDPVDEYGNLIIDFSIYDAIEVGFNEVVFIIKKEIEKDFREVIGNRIEKYINVKYVYQDLNDLPEGYSCPLNRKKPWGTGHAVLACRELVKGPFAVINADDYYGKKSLKMMADFLKGVDEKSLNFGMIGYILGNTLTDHGFVSRGLCDVDSDGNLIGINEKTHIIKTEYGAVYKEGNGGSLVPLNDMSIVSMNLWGFTAQVFPELERCFKDFLKKEEDLLKCEFFLPSAIDGLLKEKKAIVNVKKTQDIWFGVTYKEDKDIAINTIKKLKNSGIYPERLWQK